MVFGLLSDWFCGCVRVGCLIVSFHDRCVSLVCALVRVVVCFGLFFKLPVCMFCLGSLVCSLVGSSVLWSCWFSDCLPVCFVEVLVLSLVGSVVVLMLVF